MRLTSRTCSMCSVGPNNSRSSRSCWRYTIIVAIRISVSIDRSATIRPIVSCSASPSTIKRAWITCSDGGSKSGKFVRRHLSSLLARRPILGPPLRIRSRGKCCRTSAMKWVCRPSSRLHRRSGRTTTSIKRSTRPSAWATTTSTPTR